MSQGRLLSALAGYWPDVVVEVGPGMVKVEEVARVFSRGVPLAIKGPLRADKEEGPGLASAAARAYEARFNMSFANPFADECRRLG